MNAETITRRQAKVIPFLLAMPVESACAAAKIAKPTVYKWLKQDAFRAVLKRAQDAAFSDAVGQLKSNVSKAAGKLVSLVDSEDSAIALRASVAVIEHAAKLAVTEEMERRVAELEAQMQSNHGKYSA